jgi:excisionase family DNA binding protein
MPMLQSRAALTINEFCEWARLGRTRVYEEIGRGALPAIKVGRRTLITLTAAEAWLASQLPYGQR